MNLKDKVRLQRVRTLARGILVMDRMERGDVEGALCSALSRKFSARV